MSVALDVANFAPARRSVDLAVPASPRFRSSADAGEPAPDPPSAARAAAAAPSKRAPGPIGEEGGACEAGAPRSRRPRSRWPRSAAHEEGAGDGSRRRRTKPSAGDEAAPATKTGAGDEAAATAPDEARGQADGSLAAGRYRRSPPRAIARAPASRRRKARAPAPRSDRLNGSSGVTRFATWNVNSLNARQERVEQWLADVQPDIVCMQETKLADEAFPALAFEALGYESVHHGEGRWNGVAILSRGRPRRRRPRVR